MRRDGQSRGEKQPLHRVLVHAGRRAQNAGADVGDVRQLKQPLNRAVFAKRPVQHREDDVEAGACTGLRCGRGQRDAGLTAAVIARLLSASEQILRRAAREPAAFFGDAELDDVVLLSVDCLKDRAGGAQRDLVLAAAAAEENTNAKFLAGHSFPVWSRPSLCMLSVNLRVHLSVAGKRLVCR